ncbi:MAG: hypothetical protein ACPLXM_10065 [Bacteroidales bacterium]
MGIIFPGGARSGVFAFWSTLLVYGIAKTVALKVIFQGNNIRIAESTA